MVQRGFCVLIFVVRTQPAATFGDVIVVQRFTHGDARSNFCVFLTENRTEKLPGITRK